MDLKIFGRVSTHIFFFGGGGGGGGYNFKHFERHLAFQYA